jgi:hypothetical protein
MIKKILLILIAIGAYIAIISYDEDGFVFLQAEKYYRHWHKKVKDMDIEIHINKWVYDKK